MSFNVIQLPVGGYDRNFSYLVIADNRDAAVIDPCGDQQVILEAIAANAPLNPKYIILTHGHVDHYDALGEVQAQFPAPVAAHPLGQVHADMAIGSSAKLPFGDGFIELIPAPGHSRDSLCAKLSDDSAVFTGDTLFIGSVGFCRSREMYDTINKILLKLPDEIEIYPGHDYGEKPHRKMKEEKSDNVYLNCATAEDFRRALRNLE